jgi:hypothetical protein
MVKMYHIIQRMKSMRVWGIEKRKGINFQMVGIVFTHTLTQYSLIQYILLLIMIDIILLLNIRKAKKVIIVELKEISTTPITKTSNNNTTENLSNEPPRRKRRKQICGGISCSRCIVYEVRSIRKLFNCGVHHYFFVGGADSNRPKERVKYPYAFT